MADETLTPTDELRLHFQHLRRPLLSDEGRALVTYLEQRFAERREVVTELGAAGGQVQRLARIGSMVPGDPYATSWWEGARSVVLFLKDLQELEG